MSRSKDISFVIDQLTDRHPAWKHSRLIASQRIGMAGHSLGGNASAATMAADKRVRAGANLDGTFFAPVPANGLGSRPFLILGTESDHIPGKDHTWDRDWANLDGWKRWLTVPTPHTPASTTCPSPTSCWASPHPTSSPRSARWRSPAPTSAPSSTFS
ncbi:hypothetical protein AB0B45_38515 [Nonomuraea sp. NPDC049152]|uniref:hypothetical protein n=1 Tax=Nonomuraea sp. NPDC049152 TaxID=3154350 RepID=UPI0033D23FDD